MFTSRRKTAAAVSATVVAVLAAGLTPGGVAVAKPTEPPTSTGSPNAGHAAKVSDFKTPVAALAGSPGVAKGIGPARNATQLPFKVSDKIDLRVNVGSGNALVRSTDLSLPGVKGSLTLGAAYNSLLTPATTSVAVGAHGFGWRTRSGIDVRLFPADSQVTYLGPDGESGVFDLKSGSTTDYTAPDEFRADLKKTSDGFTLTQHGSGEKTAFNADGLPTKVSDRDGNDTVYTYGSGQLASVTSSAGAAGANKATVAYGSNGLISTVTQTGGSSTRKVQYFYDGDRNLTKITSAGGVSTLLGYTGHDLTRITSGTGAVTDLPTTHPTASCRSPSTPPPAWRTSPGWPTPRRPRRRWPTRTPTSPRPSPTSPTPPTP
ncbi:DUF6531 domain-containing protein [Actinomadura parmotrematis]|uniref:DUF6531 domain-containing protein n=1 Tax=Actinomadura parmotrematis TaxID=2864039 RepID=A0ABS7G1F0_9ACTN|nr:DUF6531 domain-containing protein [Actinomadura parmotrematis]MBW8486326.1 hypothetical protein [Actinomadura parmotrematis]